jgi:uncharacterized cupin superfamily protein
VITHWDEVEGVRREYGHIAGTWQALTGTNSITVGVSRIKIDPVKWSTPLHMEGSEEEIFYVLEGAGVSVQDTGDGMRAFAVRPGDCLVHLARKACPHLAGGR